MAERDPRIDAYIARSAEFARPILRHLRAVVHSACPDVEEGHQVGHACLQLSRRIDVRDGRLQAALHLRILEIEPDPGA